MLVTVVLGVERTLVAVGSVSVSDKLCVFVLGGVDSMYQSV